MAADDHADKEIEISLPLIKIVARHLHLAVAHHRKKVLRGKKNKKKHDFNFKHRVHNGYGNSHITIFKWMQDQKKYASRPLCYVEFSNDVLTLSIDRFDYNGYNDYNDCSVDIANPDSFDIIANKLIELLDWRG